MPLSRKICLKANISRLLKEYLDKLNEQGYSLKEVEKVLYQVINDSYPKDLHERLGSDACFYSIGCITFDLRQRELAMFLQHLRKAFTSLIQDKAGASYTTKR